MSKSSVPDVYARVIQGVCEASRVDFEEGGVDLGALELLKQGWQKRLTSEHVATFPWDPKPEPVGKLESTPVPSNVKPVPTTLPSNGAINTPPSSSSTPGPQIKQEQQYVAQPPLQANYAGKPYPQGQTMSAQDAAAMHLSQRFGDRASSQIAQLQSQHRVPNPVNAQIKQQSPPQQYIKQEFKQEVAERDDVPQEYRNSYNASVPIKTSQVDGAADVQEQYYVEIAHRRALIARNRVAGDRLIRDHVLASQQALEGGGLLMPLDARRERTSRAQATKTSSSGDSSLAHAQGDAAGDEEEDEDAINSDLDDPDDLDEANNGDEEVPNMMLCTYDKVQRVKNKWKCTLKDGVLKVDGTDFVFHKGQGEFEW